MCSFGVGEGVVVRCDVCDGCSVSSGVGLLFFFSSRRRHTRSLCDWSSDVCSSDLGVSGLGGFVDMPIAMAQTICR